MKKLIAIVSLSFLAACSNRPGQEKRQLNDDWIPVFEAIQSPAEANSFYPRLALSEDKEALHISWYSKTAPDTTGLYTAVREENQWSAPELVAEGSDWFINWADFPNLLAFGNGSKAISYLKKSGDDLFAYDVHLKLYSTANGNWTTDLVPHNDGTETEHGFVSMAPIGENTMGMIWLDGRNYEEADHSDHDSHGGGDMSLRFARISENGTIEEEQELDARTCDCCQTAMAATPSGLIAVYRDRSAEEVRDISYTRYEGGRWTSPHTLFADDWQIKGCPVNGPAVAAEGNEVAVAWFTAANATNKVQLIRSEDEGRSWAEPIVIDDQKPIGRVDVSLLPDRSAMVSWLDAEGALKVKRIRQDGTTAGAATVVKLEGSRSSGFPQMECSKDTLYLAWTDNGEQKQVKLAKAAL